jgi:hypothetical protein
MHNIMLRKFVLIHIKSFFQIVHWFFCSGVWSVRNFVILESGSSTTRALLFMAIPGHLTFVFVIWRLAADRIQLTVLFICLYLIAALIQVTFFFLQEIKFRLIFIGCYSSLYCSMDDSVCLETWTRSW